MGTKLEPDGYYERAEPDEPMFILLARDASAPALVELWAAERERHGEHAAVVAEARECAERMRVWRDHNRTDRKPRTALEDAYRNAIASLVWDHGPDADSDCTGCRALAEAQTLFPDISVTP